MIRNKHISILEEEQSMLDKGMGSIYDKWNIVGELKKSYEIRDSKLRQKARLKWDFEGNMNTKFFHRYIQYKRKKNSIYGIWNEGQWVSDPVAVKETFFTHFKNLFGKKDMYGNIFKLNSLQPNDLSSSDITMLVASFTLDEIEESLKSLNHTKAPGPNGLNGRFIKETWSFLKKDFMIMLKGFEENFELPGGLNSSFITLIPKTESPEAWSDYRPISLINFSMKLILKTMATRLGRVMNSLVSEHQSAFIKGKGIADGILIANEVVDSILKSSCRGVILKIDFAKAFDTVSWNFLFNTLKSMNFNETWIRWLKALFDSMRPSVLINGSPTKEFKMERGLCQGDPLSPLLFNLVGEMLHRLLDKASDSGIFKGIELKPNCHISYL